MSDNLDDILADYETGDKSTASFSKAVEGPAMGEVAFLIEADDQQALVDVGWDEDGVIVDVRVFVDRQQVEPEVKSFFGLTSLRVPPKG